MGLFCATTLAVEIRHLTWQVIDIAIRNTRPELDTRDDRYVLLPPPLLEIIVTAAA